MVALYGNHALGRGSEKKNHVVYLRFYDFTIEVPAGETLLFFCGAKIINFVGGRKKIENKFLYLI
jgi:hypothetical protein